MVHDKLKNLYKYLPNGKQSVVMNFVNQITSDMEERYYEIQGEDIFARVMSYEGKEKADCKIEAHDQYIDIQFTLQGVEGIEIYQRENLMPETDYCEKEDVQFFEKNGQAYLTIHNLPGYFSMILPEEAHSPQIAAEENRYIKKGVIKIKEKLYE